MSRAATDSKACERDEDEEHVDEQVTNSHRSHSITSSGRSTLCLPVSGGRRGAERENPHGGTLIGRRGGSAENGCSVNHGLCRVYALTAIALRPVITLERAFVVRPTSAVSGGGERRRASRPLQCHVRRPIK